VNWLVVGTGDIARKRVLPALAAESRSRIIALCDVAPDSLRSAAKEYSARSHTSFNEALRSEDVEAVYIATPVSLHAPMAIKALEAGRHVLVEKPPALSYRQASELARAAEKANGKCAVAYFRRFYPRFRMAREMLARGEFGQVVLIRMTYFSWFDPAKDDPKYWRVVPEKSGGGVLSDMGTHMFDVLIGLFGLPERVFAKVETITHSYKVEDSSVLIINYTNGMQVIGSFHWNSRTWSHEFEIIGTEAKLKWHPYDGPAVVRTVGRHIQEIELPNHSNVHYPLIESFVSSIAEGEEPAVSAEEAAKTNRLLDAVYFSARERREVEIDEILP
jgi:predicted dehydrogenase